MFKYILYMLLMLFTTASGFQKSSIVMEDKNNFLKIKMNYL
jgi:hypothetical protein